MLPSPHPPSSLMLLALITVAWFVSPVYSTSRHGLHHRQLQNGFRVGLTRVDSAGDFTKLEILQRAIKRGKHRLERLSAMAMSVAVNDQIQAPVHAGNGEFLMNLWIGTPPTPFLAIMDTGSDLIWTQCKPCTTCYSQPTPIFDPKRSSSYSNLPCTSKLCKALEASKCSDGCNYLYAYGDYSMTEGVMALETLSFGNSPEKLVSVPKIGFGCGQDNEGSGFQQAAGLIGLGRGPLSLVSQLGVKKFSYCLTSIDDNTTSSSLLFGSLADLKKTDGLVKSTPMIQNPSMLTYYYLSLEGITVGDTKLSIPESTFALNEDGTGGMIIDSGTTITYLEESSFKKLSKALVTQIKLPVSNDDSTGLDLCFSLPSDASTIEVPKLIFHFKGADLDLPAENYMIGDTGLGLLCLAMGRSTGMSVFGNVQQQNILVLHDFKKEMVSFLPTQCDQL